MTQAVLTEKTAIGFGLGCSDACDAFAGPLLLQLQRGDYEWPMAVLPLEQEWSEWICGHRTTRKRSLKARNLGYYVETFERAERVGELEEINRSLDQRQGRAMSESYSRPLDYGNELWSCPEHRVTAYGVFREGSLVAYAFIYRAGDLALVSQILDHGDHRAGNRNTGLMYLLLSEVYRAEREQGGFLVYNRMDSGTAGLQGFKEHFGFMPTRVEWTP